MIVELDVPNYSAQRGIQTEWDEGFEIAVSSDAESVLIRANRAGLRSLARHLLALADPAVPAGAHVHLDQYNSLEDGSKELIIERE